MNKLFFFALILLSAHVFGQNYPPDTTYDIIAAPSGVSLPGYLQTYDDTTTGTQIKRITQPSNLYSSGYPRHDYAKIQPWNANATLYKYYSVAIYDAQTHQIVKNLRGTGIYRSYWSNTNPDLIYGFRQNGRIVQYSVSNDQVTLMHDLNATPTYRTVEVGFGEGNIDMNDKYVVLAGNPTNTEDITVIVYDLQLNQIVATKNFAGAWGNTTDHPTMAQYLNWVSVSQSGNYVGFNWDHNNTSASNPYIDQLGNSHFGIEVFDINLNFQRRVADYGNHGDFGFTPSGDEVYVQFWGQGTGSIFAYHLANGQVDIVLNHTQVTQNPAHISCRNLLRPGWAYVSTDQRTGDGRIFAVKLDGSGTIEEFGHAFSSNFPILPVPNLVGDKVMFSSDFGLASPEHYDFEAYAIPTASVRDEKSKIINIYPNPAQNILYISSIKNTKIEIFNSIGVLVYQKEIIEGKTSINIAHFSKGIYYIKAHDNFIEKIVVVE